MKKSPNNWIGFSSLTIQIAVIVYFAVKIGNWLDVKFNENNFFTFLTCIFSITIIIYLIIKQTKKFKD